MKSRQVTALVLGMFFVLGQLDTVFCCNDRKGDGDIWRDVKCTMADVAADVAADFVSDYVLPTAGFTKNGIKKVILRCACTSCWRKTGVPGEKPPTCGQRKCSMAAKYMSKSTGGVDKQSVFGTLQSAGAGGDGKARVKKGAKYLAEKLFG